VRNFSRVLLILLLAISCKAQVEATFFGMCVNKIDSFPLTVPIGSLRLWDTGTNWLQLCPTSDYSRCDWRHLEKWLAVAKSNGISEVMYTFGKTPAWISSNPQNSCGGRFPGACFPPRDVASDGGGSDAAFKGFVRAIVEHNQRLDPKRYAKIKYWGMWNEPGAKNFWQGTDAQMVRMVKDAYPIIKAADVGALVLSPEPAANSKKGLNAAGDWLDHYFSAGGSAYADVIAFHGAANAVGPGDHPVVEDIIKLVNNVKEKVARHPELAGKPLWLTEGQWGHTNEANWTGFDQAAGFVVRWYTLLASLGVRRVYWYMYDGNPGAMWTRESGELPTAVAFKEAHKWLLGRTVSPCSAQGHVWSCDLTGPGYKGKIVWYDQYEKTASYDATGFAGYRDISGGANRVEPKAHTITLGNRPVLLETVGSSQ
jgi:hypothetical protein